MNTTYISLHSSLVLLNGKAIAKQDPAFTALHSSLVLLNVCLMAMSAGMVVFTF